jgi:hypothetical protein
MATSAGLWTIQKTGSDEDGERFLLLVVDPRHADSGKHVWNSGEEMDERELIEVLTKVGLSDIAIAAALHKARERFGLLEQHVH